MSFDGFTLLPDSAWPAQLVLLAGRMRSPAALRVLLFLFERYFLSDRQPIPLTIDQIQAGTSLSRGGAVSGLHRLLAGGLVERNQVGNRFEYQPLLDPGPDAGLPCTCNIPSYSSQSSLTEEATCLLGEREEVYRLLAEEFEVQPRVARDIADRRDPKQVKRQIEYARIDVARGQVRNRAGYIVARIRDNWGPPPGHSPLPKQERWYTDEEERLYFYHGPRDEEVDDAA